MAATAAAIASGGEKGSKRAVLIKAEKQSDDDGQAASAEEIGTDKSVFWAKNKQSDKNPKGCIITLGATIHK